MKNAILGFLTVSILGISCQQDDPPTPVVADKYMSLTAGSTWNYELVNNIATTTTPFVLTATSKDSVISTRTYKVFTNSSGSANEYYNISGNDYYAFRNLPAGFGSTSVENIYLKDNATVGTSWSQPYPLTVSGVALIANVTNTITAKGISKTVKGTVYTGVIHVTTTIVVTIGGVPLPAGALTTDIQSFYVAKVGLIQSVNKSSLNFGGVTDNTDQQTSLVSANIK